jgi:thiamine-phosphate pyrophosphorylase
MTLPRKVFRVLDANFNRSREGLRVCEDIARFMFSSSVIAKDLKAVRHGVSSIMKSTPGMTDRLLDARDTMSDCGRAPDRKIEVSRRKSEDIFIANIERVKESLRVLEEFYKLIDDSLSAKFAQLRFKTYAIEKNVLKRYRSIKRSRLFPPHPTLSPLRGERKKERNDAA